MNRHRSLVMTLVCMGLGALSCQVLSAGPAADAQSPFASAPQSASAADDDQSTTLVPPSGLEVTLHEESLAVARILSVLEHRHTLLAAHELQLLAETIVEEAQRHAVDPDLVMAVIQVESGGQPLAVSNVGAMGLMQLLPSTGEELARKHGIEWHGPVTLFDSVVNVKLGTAYLHQLMERYGDISTALAAYNWGPGRIDRRLRRGAAVPSRYARLVMKAFDAREPEPARRL